MDIDADTWTSIESLSVEMGVPHCEVVARAVRLLMTQRLAGMEREAAEDAEEAESIAKVLTEFQATRPAGKVAGREQQGRH